MLKINLLLYFLMTVLFARTIVTAPTEYKSTGGTSIYSIARETAVLKSTESASLSTTATENIEKTHYDRKDGTIEISNTNFSEPSDNLTIHSNADYAINDTELTENSEMKLPEYSINKSEITDNSKNNFTEHKNTDDVIVEFPNTDDMLVTTDSPTTESANVDERHGQRPYGPGIPPPYSQFPTNKPINIQQHPTYNPTYSHPPHAPQQEGNYLSGIWTLITFPPRLIWRFVTLPIKLTFTAVAYILGL